MAREEIIVKAQKRDISIKVKSIRENGFIPAVVYRKGQDAVSMQLEYQEFRKAYRITGDSTPMTIEFDGKKILTLIHDVQYEPVYDDYTHIDFLELDEKEPVKASIPIILKGLAPAVKNLQGTLISPIDSIEIECLPRHLIHEITVDVSGIEDFHTAIHVNTLEIANNKNITIITDGDAVLASVSAPKGASEDEEESAEEGAEGEEKDAKKEEEK